jgi:hypothetical protein
MIGRVATKGYITNPPIYQGFEASDRRNASGDHALTAHPGRGIMLGGKSRLMEAFPYIYVAGRQKGAASSFEYGCMSSHPLDVLYSGLDEPYLL